MLLPLGNPLTARSDPPCSVTCIHVHWDPRFGTTPTQRDSVLLVFQLHWLHSLWIRSNSDQVRFLVTFPVSTWSWTLLNEKERRRESEREWEVEWPDPRVRQQRSVRGCWMTRPFSGLRHVSSPFKISLIILELQNVTERPEQEQTNGGWNVGGRRVSWDIQKTIPNYSWCDIFRNISDSCIAFSLERMENNFPPGNSHDFQRWFSKNLSCSTMIANLFSNHQNPGLVMFVIGGKKLTLCKNSIAQQWN